jgi:uncharacterized protein with GYD domain
LSRVEIADKIGGEANFARTLNREDKNADVHMLPELDRAGRSRAAKEAATRNAGAKALAEKLGARIISTYVTTGQYDVVLTLEMPDRDAMTKFAVALMGTGNARTTTVNAMTPEEFGRLAAEAP